MSTTTLTDINDVFGQAQDGSVAAIIQILNDQLADSGIRTRAVFVDNVLQLLCEAPTDEQLKKSVVVETIRSILEDIGPRRIRRVNINSRLVQEQQLLWLEEINRDPENHLLWAEMIMLKQPHWWKRIIRDLRRPKFRGQMPEGASKSDLRQRKSFLSGIIGGLSVALLLTGVSIWAVRQRFDEPAPATAAATDPSTADQLPLPESYDSFARAVRIAEQAAKDGLIAENAADWLALAARWQQASDLMAEVPVSDERYKIAQDRVNAYRSNSESLLQKARQVVEE
ncbi:hypothetical protein IQ260_23445 [Leptolyngbya cf. ectocarpi LEGE 11479]|uniref:Uncharacterized protein n=1 Tax=Leptolyngbya cf. ectocarpi LEGE 11479 TaxID=1828722 RepID=A0A928ZY25_LEPEC|nr:hypothetical protein [Leptolyngbya ectocarpi]MBE9069604.1 hypothetical protein [Leptolyngbya cf. ectocarpi LEGE 11479]